MTTGPNYRSYRDPAARVVKKEDGWYRYILPDYQKEYDHLIQSGLYRELIENKLLITHDEIEAENNDPGVYKVLRPEQIPFQSYPFEWSYSQWQRSILAFLDINITALKYGMILKDASPYNFYLKGGKSMLLDTSSFTFFKTNDFWLAYLQFCEEFLSPFALMHFNGLKWGKLSGTYLRGMPLAFVSKQLSWRSWFNLTCLLHIHWHSRYSRAESGGKKEQQKGFDAAKLSGLFSMVRSTISSWRRPYQLKHHWSGYYENDIEAGTYLTQKQKIVEEWLSNIIPASVIDLGANTGKFSLIAAKYAGYAVALEQDENCVDEIERKIERDELINITALIGDLAEPAPGSGVLNREYTSIFTRGRSEMVLGLALVHHLCLSRNITLNLIAEMFSEFTTGFAMVEFIPKEDKKGARLLSNRQDIFKDYDEEHFIGEFSVYFNLLKVAELPDTSRKLFLWEKK